MSKVAEKRVVHRNIHVTDIVRYRLPAAGVVSIIHRISGAVLFMLTPLLVWLFASSVSSESAFAEIRLVMAQGAGVLPGWSIRLVLWILIGAGLAHALAGLRHLWMDATHRLSAEHARSTALVVLSASAALWLALGARLFNLY